MIQNYVTRWTVLGFILSLILIFTACQNKPNSSSTNQEISFLALGDSYTIGESVEKNQRWPVLLADSLKNRGIDLLDPDIIAKTGWTTTDLQKAIDEQKPDSTYDLVSLLIGVNNQYQGLDFNRFEEEFEELLNQAITFADGDAENVFVVSIPNYGVTPFGQNRNPDQIREELTKYNETAQSIAEQYEITFVNITPISERASDDPTLTADDNLHPSGKMYQLWVQKMIPNIIPKVE